MKKKILVVLLVILTMFLFSCGKKEYIPSDYSGYVKATEDNINLAQNKEDNFLVPSSRKLICSADLSIQTLKFEESVAQLKDLVIKYNGYYESSRQDNGSYFDNDSYNYGNYVIRIPCDKYNEFIKEINDRFHVVSISENTKDITDSYYEVETHVNTLEIKIDRLQELLKSAKTMADIIELENALSSAEYELERYINILNQYDGLINYATINLDLAEVRNYDAIDSNFFQSLWDNISGGLYNVVSILENLIYWIGYNLILIIALVVIILLAIKKKWFKRICDKRKRRKETKCEENK